LIKYRKKTKVKTKGVSPQQSVALMNFQNMVLVNSVLIGIRHSRKKD
jgi:hypothetical protein